MQVIKEYVTYLVVRIIICMVQAMTIENCALMSRWLGWLAVDVLGVRKKVVDENLRHAFPDWSPKQRKDVARKMWAHLILMACEIAHTPRKVHCTNWYRFSEMNGKREMVRHLIEDRPMVILSGHFGNFEVGNFITGLLGFSAYAVARPLENRFLDRFIRRFREAKGQFILPKAGSGPAVEAILSWGGTLSVLGDQYGGQKGCWIEFFGRPASSHKAIALFSLGGKAPLLVMYAARVKPMYFDCSLVEVADPQIGGDHMQGVKQLTQWYTTCWRKASDVTQNNTGGCIVAGKANRPNAC